MSVLFPRTREVIAEWTATGHHIGAQVYISRDRTTLADFAVGESRPGVPMSTDTLMLWLSAGKPLAAVALAQLREKGLLDFDDLVARFIPEFATGGKESITLKHILTHTAGLRFIDMERAKPPLGWGEVPWDDIIAMICRTPIEADWTPGERAGYSPFASWYVLGEVVRRLDGRPYEQYVRDEILQPLGMNDCWLAVPPQTYHAYGDRIGVMMNTARKPPEPSGFDTERAAGACRPGGSARGPAKQLGRFYEMLVNRGSAVSLTSAESPIGVSPVPILSTDSVDLITRPHRVGLFDYTFRHDMDWGLGFIVNTTQHGVETVPYGFGPVSSPRAFGHGGAQSTCAFADPDRNLVVVIIFNGQPGEPAHHRRLKATLAAVEEDLAQRL